MTAKPTDPDVCERCGGRSFFWDNFKPDRQCSHCDPKILKKFHTVNLVELPTIDPKEVGPPCAKCGERVLFWWTINHKRRCQTCDPPKRARLLMRFNEDRFKAENGLA